MIKSLRTVFGVLFLSSLFCLASCCNSNWCDGFNSSCGPRACAPCAPACEPCQQPRCEPCGITPCSLNNTSPDYAPVSSGYAQPSAQPAAAESNPYFPCDPSAAPCGNGHCNSPASADLRSPCYGNMRCYSTCDDCIVDLVQVAPEFATVGSPYPIEITITARKECAEVKVNQQLPPDAEFIRSEPCAQPDCNGALVWTYPHLTQGESQTIRVWVKPRNEGCCLSTATICACPQLCAYTRCGQPIICIKKCGPETACLGSGVTYKIDVSNSGSATAYDVVVQDNVPEGLVHSSGYKTLTYNLGNLGPNECRTFNVDFCAANRGTVCNTATVSFCGGPKCTAEACTKIVEGCVEVTKTGPDWAYLCKPVEYTITVTNPGDVVLRDVVVDDISPVGTTIVDAPGAEICCSRAVWTICQLCPGETKTFNVTLKSQVTGCLTNKVNVTSQSECGPCTSCAEATTLWKGIAAIHMCMVDTVDPICVGDTTVYRICVTNRGTADDSNIELKLNFTNEVQPISINGPTNGTIEGQTVKFAPIGRLAPKESVEFSVTVKGVSAGDARADASLSSESMTNAVTDTENTHVY